MAERIEDRVAGRRTVSVVTVTMVGLLAGLAAFLASSAVAAAEKEDAALQHARQLLKSTILIDGHNDLPWAIRNDKTKPEDVAAYDLRGKVPGQTDLKRLREGGVGAQFWSVYIPGEMGKDYARVQLEQIDIARQVIERYPDTFQFATTAADIRAAKKAGRIGSLIGIEGGHAIENSLGALRAYYDLGVRYMTLTHNVNLDWADCAAQPPVHNGLTSFGEEVVREMNRLGMLVDLSHVSPDTMRDALRVSKAPVIFSHSSARALTDHPRNVPDDVLKLLPANGGVVMVAFVVPFVDEDVRKFLEPYNAKVKEATKGMTDEAEIEKVSESIMGSVKLPPTPISKVADHIEHIRDVAGIEHVGIGADYDGNDQWPVGLSDVTGYPHVFAELIRRGWKDPDLKKLAGENVLAAMEKAEKVSAELRKTTPASTAHITQAAAAN